MKEFIKAPKKIYHQAKAEGRLIECSSIEKLKEMAAEEEGVILTQTGSIAADSEPMSRAAMHTKNNEDYSFGEKEKELAGSAEQAFLGKKIISVDAQVGEKERGVTVRVLIPAQYPHLAYFTKRLLGPLKPFWVANPTYWIVIFTDGAFENNKRFREKVAERDITIRLWMGRKRGEQVKIIRNSTYFGEIKKGVFAFENWRAKTIDGEGIFLHAGARRDHLWVFDAKSQRPQLKEITTLIAGLTATGKTTTLCRALNREKRESSEMIGDDGGTLYWDGSYSIFEPQGVYVKTEGIELGDQPEIYRAALAADACLENVAITRYPYVPNFMDFSKTANGRAVISRKRLEIASRDLRAQKVNNIVLLTKNPLINAISKLTPEQCVMQLIYGESTESSGGDPTMVGKFIRQFFLDPFVAGNRLEHAMLFYQILKKHNIKCYLSNTGTIGENKIKVTLRDSLAIYSDILRGQMKFSTIPDSLGYFYAIKSDRANSDILRAEPKFKNREAFEKQVTKFLQGRQNYLEEFEKGGNKIPEEIKESLRYK